MTNNLPPLYTFPEPKRGVKRGPSPVQKPLFIYHKKPPQRPHNHELDVVLMVGGAGSGKTAAAIAEITEVTAQFPNVKAVVGGKNYPLLKRNVITEFGRRFSADGDDWDHPIVKRKPTQNDMVMRTIHGASLSFLNLDKYLVARGFDADIVMIEEVNLMEAQSFDEMIRRSRGRVLPIRQFVLTMNPTGDRDWLYYKFNMRQFEPDYDGPPVPIGEPCKCQFCNICLDHNVGAFEWVDGVKHHADYKDHEGNITKDRCYAWSGGHCPNCGHQKETDCPGNQYFYRVIRSKSYDNPHNPSSYTQDMKATLDPESYKLYVEGQIIQLRTGKVYKSFTSENVLKQDIELNWEKDMIWTHDFNVDPMCSVIWQETDWGVHVVDEIVERDANEEKVAKAFVEKYRGYKGTVYIYGDPAGLYGSGRSESRRTSYQILYDYLKLHKFNVEVIMKKVKGETKIYIKDRINNVNAMLCNAKHEIRVKINPSCQFLIQSLSSVNWAANGNEEDKSIDDLAKEVVNWETVIPIMTHPSCAFGYAIAKRFPIIQKKQAGNFIMTETGTVMQADDGTVSYNRKESAPKEAKLDPKEDEKFVSVFEPVAMHSALKDKGFGGFSNHILQERLAQEQKEREEYMEQLNTKIQKLTKNN